MQTSIKTITKLFREVGMVVPKSKETRVGWLVTNVKVIISNRIYHFTKKIFKQPLLNSKVKHKTILHSDFLTHTRSW